ncbi:MAG TPA: bifunctional UDP-N-acetylglucosamine diphosphorylase/glucosamine-1-phosphate N-acetyltransferase GlmU [Alphaproteobacteria bacterium]|nr:bifunctional UDP-N-acetylglucosamine diphosphorylase/glucosamine-1-phosphate N-acetyltransferase GlmU [Alphaproteobacteria bacterium]
MTDRPLAVVVLAAGKGTRMRSERPKVLHPVAGRPMLAHVLAAAEALSPQKIVVVLAPGMDSVAEAAQPHTVAIQEAQRGTADALKAARGALAGFGGDVLVLYGDCPLIRAETLARMRRERLDEAVTVLGIRVRGESAYGRLILAADGTLDRIVETLDAKPEELVDLCNSGVMLIDGKHMFPLLDAIGSANAKGEYYLTDIVGEARRTGLAARVVEAPAVEALGVNSRAELAEAEAQMQARLRASAMENGATLIDPSTIWLSFDTKLGRDVTVGPSVFFGPGVTVADRVEIRAFCHLEGANVAEGAIIGPFARLRPGARIGVGAHVGNFVEIKNALLDAGAKANHLAYLGDAEIGAGANIGAGTITCNYDGFNKHRTIVGAGAFIGSDTTLVAPVKVGAGAFVGAGSTVTDDVPEDALAIARGRQAVKLGWARMFRAARTKKKD